MKKLTTVSLAALIAGFFLPGDIHNYSVPKIEGGNQSLSAYQGKKVLIITLPLTQNAMTDSMLYRLDTLAAARVTGLKVIAVPSYEDGYTPSQKNQLRQWYRSKLGAYVLVTDGLRTRKTSGAQQHPLFKWLTDDTKNDVFNIDVAGPWFKFFARGNGKLYGVLRPHSPIGGTSVQKTLKLP